MPAPPWPLLELSLEPKARRDAERLSEALAALLRSDPALTVTREQESGQILLGGRNERHLDAAVSQLRAQHAIDAHVGTPQVAYREAPTRRATIDYTRKKLSLGINQFARVTLTVEPTERGAGCRIESTITEGALPPDLRLGIETGLRSVLPAGILAGCPLTDARIDLVDAAWHETDSSVLAFEIAARAALREVLHKAGSVLIEPVMLVEVSVPQGSVAAALADLRSRRAHILDGGEGRAVAIVALVPLATLFGYENVLKALSCGKGSFDMRFAGYEPIPRAPDDDPLDPAPALSLRA